MTLMITTVRISGINSGGIWLPTPQAIPPETGMMKTPQQIAATTRTYDRPHPHVPLIDVAAHQPPTTPTPDVLQRPETKGANPKEPRLMTAATPKLRRGRRRHTSTGLGG